MADDRLTKPTAGDVEAFLDSVPDERRRCDAQAATELVREATGAEPVMWGTSMVGFGTQHYTTADGKEREWFAVGLAPRASDRFSTATELAEALRDALAGNLAPITRARATAILAVNGWSSSLPKDRRAP